MASRFLVLKEHIHLLPVIQANTNLDVAVKNFESVIEVPNQLTFKIGEVIWVLDLITQAL